MVNIPEKYNKEDVPTYKILQGIKTGSLDAKNLLKEERQACVEMLALEGHQVSAIAQLLDRSEKTIKRDLKEIWQKNSQMPTPEFVLREIAEMIEKGKVHQAHLMRIARSKDTLPKEKIEAERNAWKIGKEIAERLQSLGFLPNAPQKVVGEMYHHNVNDEVSISEQKKQLAQLIETAKKDGVYDKGKVLEEIENIEKKITKAEIKKDIENLSNDINKAKERGEGEDEK